LKIPYRYHIEPDKLTGRSETIQISFRLTDENGSPIVFSPLPCLATADYDGSFRKAFQAVVLSNAHTDKESRHTAKNAMITLLNMCSRAIDANIPLLPCFVTDSRIEQAITYIKDNFNRPIDSQTLADICHISEQHLRRLFKSVTGVSVLQYKNDLLLQSACHLLSETKKTVGEIADYLGFCDIYAFSHWFHQKQGQSPTEYRRNS